MRVLTGRPRAAAFVHAARLAGCLIVLGGASGPAHAAEGSIECGKAELADEKAICAEIPLVQQDARMATLYAVAMSLSGMGERGDLQDGQAAWLDRRHACKADAACLREAYETRIGQLQKVLDAIASRGPL